MNKNYIDIIAKSKKRFHKKRAEMLFEEKVKVIIELQKINEEIRKSSKDRGEKNNMHKVWQLQS